MSYHYCRRKQILKPKKFFAKPYLQDARWHTGITRLNKITSAMEKTAGQIKKKLPKIYSKDLIEILFRLPYTKRQHLIDEHIGNPKTAGNYLQLLEEAGFLTSVKVGKEKLYLNHELMKIL